MRISAIPVGRNPVAVMGANEVFCFQVQASVADTRLGLFALEVHAFVVREDCVDQGVGATRRRGIKGQFSIFLMVIGHLPDKHLVFLSDLGLSPSRKRKSRWIAQLEVVQRVG